MNLQAWAERLLAVPSAPDAIERHLEDTLAAFLCGLDTNEGEELARFFAGRPAELAAAAAAITRLSECDDIHLRSCITAGSVVIPIALAFAHKGDENAFNRAVSAGYKAGLTLGGAISGAKALPAAWPTLLAAPLMAAVTASLLKGHDHDRLAHAMALALSGASGRLGRPSGTLSGRWAIFAEAVGKGIRAAEMACHGFCGDLALLSEAWLAAQAGQSDVDAGIWDTGADISDVGFKPFPIARQGANAVAAFQRLLLPGLDPRRIDSVEVFVPAMNVMLLKRQFVEGDRLSRLANIGFQLACAAFAPGMLYDPERNGPAGPLMDFARRVSVSPAGDLDQYLPHRWPARVVIKIGSEQLEETVIDMDFDAPAGKNEILQRLQQKWRRLLPEDNHRDFASNLAGAGPGRHAMLWQWLEGRLRGAAHKGRL